VDTSTGFEPAAPMPATSATPKEKLVASNTESQSTGTSNAFYFTATRNPGVLSYKEDKRPRVLFKWNDEGAEQKWDIEIGDEPNVVALKCVAAGKYLRCLKAKHSGEVALGDKQWWRM
jgi:hypothetical protein